MGFAPCNSSIDSGGIRIGDGENVKKTAADFLAFLKASQDKESSRLSLEFATRLQEAEKHKDEAIGVAKALKDEAVEVAKEAVRVADRHFWTVGAVSFSAVLAAVLAAAMIKT